MKGVGLSCLLVLFLLGVSSGYEVATHQRLFEESLKVLEGDGYQVLSEMFSQEETREQIMAGLKDADEKATGFHWDHGLDPWTHQGFNQYQPSAGQTNRSLFWQAVTYWKEDQTTSAYLLGLAIHRLEDVTFTSHSNLDWGFILAEWDFLYPAKGHVGSEYYAQWWLESFSAEELLKLGFLVEKGGIYNFEKFTKDGLVHCSSSDPFGWVDYAAHQSYGWLEELRGTEPGSDIWQEVTKKQFTLCQRVVAGFLVFFFRVVSLTEVPLLSGELGGWPMFGYNPQHTNEVSYIGKKPERILWQKQGISNWPVVSKEGMIYAAGERLYALGPDGLEVWVYDFEAPISSDSSPAIDSQGNIYISAGGDLYCLDPNGILRWRKEDISDYSPMIDSLGRLVVFGRSYLSVLDANSDLIWQTQAQNEVVPAISSEGTIYLAKTNWRGGKVSAFGSGGSLKWEWSGLEGWEAFEITLAPDGAIYVASKELTDLLFCLNPDGTLRWKIEYHKGLLYGGDYTGLSISSSNVLYTTCWFPFGYSLLWRFWWNQETKEWENWDFRKAISFGPPNRFAPPIIDAQGQVCVGTSGAELYALKPSNGSVIWEYHPPENLLSWYFEKAPKMVMGPDGTFYIVLMNSLYALGSEVVPTWQKPVTVHQSEPVVFEKLGLAMTINSPSMSEVKVQVIDEHYQIETGVDSLISVDLAISYDEENLTKQGIKEERATLAFSKDQGKTWQVVETIRDLAKNVLYAFGLGHLSLWTIVEGSEEITALSEIPPAPIPQTFHLFQNYPNPFNSETTIKFQLPKRSEIVLKIYNLLGQEVGTLISEEKEAGFHSVRWDGKSFASGIYFYRLEAGDFTTDKRMILVK